MMLRVLLAWSCANVPKLFSKINFSKVARRLIYYLLVCSERHSNFGN